MGDRPDPRVVPDLDDATIDDDAEPDDLDADHEDPTG